MKRIKRDHLHKEHPLMRDHFIFISAVLFGRNELEEGPMSASLLFKAIEQDGERL
jgi:hypothetical protein